MSPDIEFPRWEGVHPLAIDVPFPDILTTSVEVHQEAMRTVSTLSDTYSSHDTELNVSIPITSVYTNTIYKNHFIDFGIDLKPGVYIFMGRGCVLYVGQSQGLAHRLRTHVLNYQREGLNSRSPFVGYTENIRAIVTQDHLDLEKHIIKLLKPIWNR